MPLPMRPAPMMPMFTKRLLPPHPSPGSRRGRLTAAMTSEAAGGLASRAKDRQLRSRRTEEVTRMDQPTAEEALKKLEPLIGEWTLEAIPPGGEPWPGEGRATMEWHEAGHFDEMELAVRLSNH